MKYDLERFGKYSFLARFEDGTTKGVAVSGGSEEKVLVDAVRLLAPHEWSGDDPR